MSWAGTRGGIIFALIYLQDLLALFEGHEASPLQNILNWRVPRERVLLNFLHALDSMDLPSGNFLNCRSTATSVHMCI